MPTVVRNRDARAFGHGDDGLTGLEFDIFPVDIDWPYQDREYTTQELTELLSHAGFEIELMFTSDVYTNHANFYCDPNKFVHLVDNRKADLGQYIFVKARNTSAANLKKPTWLYRSYPPDQLSEW